MPDRRSTRLRLGRGRRARRLLSVPLLGLALLAVGAVSGLAADKTIEATGSSPANYAWTPSSAAVSPGGTVELKNSAGIHAVTWESGPATPSCPGVPGAGASNWSGTCTFAQAGEYKFYCPVHPSTMKGTVDVDGPGPPVATTEPATVIKDTEATLNGKVNPSGQSTTFYFKYGTTTAYGQETTDESAGSGSTTLSKSATVTGLTAATTYHFQLVAENASGTTLGVDRTFTTAGPPTATTQSATGVGGVEATLAGQVNPKGLETTYFFNYGTTDSYGLKTTEKVAGSGTSAVSKTELVAGLSPETTYHFQLVAKNSAGEVKGIDKTFTTLGAPLATTGQAAGVGVEAATLEGTVNPQGQQTTYHFKFGTTAAYGQETAEKSAGKGIAGVGVSEPLTGLSPDTTYHFQLVAVNDSGTTLGADQTFTTGSNPPLSPPSSPSSPPSPPGPDPSPPDTKITLKPGAKTRDRTPTIKFNATAAGAAYLCSVDGKPFKSCRSPFTAPSLKPGNHRIRVKAVFGGAEDPTPASCSFKVLAAKRGKR